MPEVSTPVQMVALTYDCDECGEEMRYAGFSYATTGAVHHHRCENGHTAVLSKMYPTQGWQPLEANVTGLAQ